MQQSGQQRRPAAVPVVGSTSCTRSPPPWRRSPHVTVLPPSHANRARRLLDLGPKSTAPEAVGTVPAASLVRNRLIRPAGPGPCIHQLRLNPPPAPLFLLRARPFPPPPPPPPGLTLSCSSAGSAACSDRMIHLTPPTRTTLHPPRIHTLRRMQRHDTPPEPPTRTTLSPPSSHPTHTAPRSDTMLLLSPLPW